MSLHLATAIARSRALGDGAAFGEEVRDRLGRERAQRLASAGERVDAVGIERHDSSLSCLGWVVPPPYGVDKAVTSSMNQ